MYGFALEQNHSSDTTTTTISKTPSFEVINSHAQEYRLNPSLPSDQEEERQKKILESVYTNLVNYNSGNCLEDAIKAFLADSQSVDPSLYIIIDAKKTDIKGKSHDPVFLIKDKNDTLCYVVKAFLNPRELSSKFLPEISALNLLEDLALPHVTPIKPLGFARYTDGKQEWGLLIETAASGKRLDQYIFQLAKPDLNSEELQSRLKIAEKAFYRTGQCLAELHKIKSPIPAIIPLSERNKFDDKLTRLLENPVIVNELSKNICMSDFIEYLNAIRNQILDVPVPCSYWHGDAHLGNMIYDETNDRFSFIDVAKMHRSVDLYGLPLLDGTIDLMRVEENLHRKALSIIPEKEINRLITSFYQGYEDEAGQLPDERIRLFYRIYKKLGRLVKYVHYLEEMDPVQRSIDNAIFDNTINYFSNVIKK